jgi:hypothetical protein
MVLLLPVWGAFSGYSEIDLRHVKPGAADLVPHLGKQNVIIALWTWFFVPGSLKVTFHCMG